MNKNILVLVVAIFCMFSGFAARHCHAAFYQYTDEKGVVNVTDNLQSVPEQFRDKAVIVSGAQVETQETTTQKAAADDAPAAATPAPEATSKQERSFVGRLIVSLVIVGFGIAVLIVLAKAHLPEQLKKHTPHVRKAVIGVLVLYLLVAHAKDALILFFMAGHKVESIREESAEKGKKAAETFKKIDALFEAGQSTQGKESGQDAEK